MVDKVKTFVVKRAAVDHLIDTSEADIEQSHGFNFSVHWEILNTSVQNNDCQILKQRKTFKYLMNSC